MSNSTATVRFTVDFVAKKISGTKASFDKAKKGSGPIYEELARKVASHPDFTIEVIASKKPAASKPREVYKGLSIEFMRAYLEMEGNAALAEKLEKVITFATKNRKKPYPLVKKYFLKQFADSNGNINFDYAKAKADVEEYLIRKTTLERAKATDTHAATALDLAPASNF